MIRVFVDGRKNIADVLGNTPNLHPNLLFSCYCILKRNQGVKRGDIFSNQTKMNSPPNNGAILTLSTMVKAVVSSAAKAELGALYLNAKEAAYLCQVLAEMNHPQPQTPIQTNNSMAEGVCNHKIQLKQTKSNGHALSLAI
jgi:hypothetical protein